MSYDLFILDNFVDDREFRNYVTSILSEKGFSNIEIDDVGLRDQDNINDNDIKAEKDGMTYTIQTFLNKEITTDEIDETVNDIDFENVGCGILVTNSIVSEEVRNYAREKNVKIWDRTIFEGVDNDF